MARDYCEENDISEIVKIIYEEDDDFDYLTYDVTGLMSLDDISKNSMNEDAVLKILRKNQTSNYSLIRNYKRGCKTPGLLEIYFDEYLDVNFFRTLIKKHYGYELGKTDSLSLDLIFLFEKDKDVVICHLYDDRGFQIFYLSQ